MDLRNNLLSLFSESPRTRELRETRERWANADELWRASPAATKDAGDFALDFVGEVMRGARPLPAFPIVEALYNAARDLISLEDITGIEPDWVAIESDAAVAMRIREMLARRTRWAANFDHLYRIVLSHLHACAADFLSRLPPLCFEERPEREDVFGVPLAEMLDRPAELIERLIVFPYDDDTQKYDLFFRFRKRLELNLVVASGFSPDTNIFDVEKRLVLPTRQKNQDPTALARMYLGGTPLEGLLEVPLPFSVPDAARFEHCHIIGGTGHGKTQLLQSLIHRDLLAALEERRAVVVIDSQGDLITKLRRLALFDPHKLDNLADRFVLIDPADVEFPASLNLFDTNLARLSEYRPADQERVLNGVVELYETFFGDLLGAELTQKQGVIFKYLARLMISIPGATIHTLMQLMDDGRPFKRHMDKLEGSARYFFEKEFFDPSFAATKKQILKRLWGVLATPAFERMFAQRENKLDLFEALQDGKIILVSTAKDLLKRDGSQLFGRFFIAMLAQAALERSTVPEDERTPAFVYIDEAQEYFGDDVETILNQARKYRVGLTLAHQTLDQLSPRLRSVLAANTSFKCVGGVSAKDARTLADELHTEVDFIESMRRRGDRTEFAAWLKNHTPRAVRLSVPLGFLERQPTLSEESYDELERINRLEFCGTLADVERLSAAPRERPEIPAEEAPLAPAREPPTPRLPLPPSDAAPTVRQSEPYRRSDELGKGGPKHRYLQNLVKELGEAQGFMAVIEAPLPSAPGQIDVLLKRSDLAVAVEISVSTPVEVERENVRKCLAAGYPRVALVLVKSTKTQGRYRELIGEGFSEDERQRLTFLAPEDIPDFIAALTPPPEAESVVKGYRVKLSRTAVSPDEAKQRRDTIARLVARSIREQS